MATTTIAPISTWGSPVPVLPPKWAAIWNIVDEAPTLLNVDLVRLDHVDDALRQAIEREGVVLYACH